MPTIINPAKQRLQQGQLALGMGVRGLRGVEVGRVMKTAGYDFLFIDLEHGAASVETAFQISVGALDAGIAPLIRVWSWRLPSGVASIVSGCCASSIRTWLRIAIAWVLIASMTRRS